MESSEVTMKHVSSEAMPKPYVLHIAHHVRLCQASSSLYHYESISYSLHVHFLQHARGSCAEGLQCFHLKTISWGYNSRHTFVCVCLKGSINSTCIYSDLSTYMWIAHNFSYSMYWKVFFITQRLSIVQNLEVVCYLGALTAACSWGLTSTASHIPPWYFPHILVIPLCFLSMCIGPLCLWGKLHYFTATDWFWSG